MKKFKNLVDRIISRGPMAVTLAVIVSVLFVTGLVQAATTISTNIATDGNATVGGTLDVTGASTLGTVAVGGGTTISSMLFGYCTLAAINVTTATTTYANCTGAEGAANVTSAYRVFVQATSSMPVATFVTAASSTATTGTLNVRFHANAGAASISANTVSLQVWAIR